MASELTYSLPELGTPNATADPLVRTALQEIKTTYNAEVPSTQKAFKWYAPKEIVTEETRSNVAFGTMTTADEITGVALPAGGVIRIAYRAIWKSSVSSAGEARITLNGTGVSAIAANGVEKIATQGTTNRILMTNPASGEGVRPFQNGKEVSTMPTSGLMPWWEVFAPAGTYAVAIQFLATSGSVTVKERVLQVEVHGV